MIEIQPTEAPGLIICTPPTGVNSAGIMQKSSKFGRQECHFEGPIERAYHGCVFDPWFVLIVILIGWINGRVEEEREPHAQFPL